MKFTVTVTAKDMQYILDNQLKRQIIMQLPEVLAKEQARIDKIQWKLDYDKEQYAQFSAMIPPTEG